MVIMDSGLARSARPGMTVTNFSCASRDLPPASSFAKADDPVFQRPTRSPERPRRIGCPPARGMTAEYEAAFSRHVLPELCKILVPLDERAQGRPGADLAHGPPAEKKAGGSHHRFGRDIPAFPARVGLRLIRALPRDRLSCPCRPRARQSAADLTSAPGGQDHTTSPSVPAALVWRRLHVHRSPPLRIVTTRTSLRDEAGWHRET